VVNGWCIGAQSSLRLRGAAREDSGPSAAARIAARAGISVTDRGTVLVGGILRAIANDSLPWSAQALSPAEREAWRRRAILTAWLLLMAVAGILFLRFFAG